MQKKLRHLRVTQIELDEDSRIREDRGEIRELASSIRKKGLINPIAVEQLTSRRFRVIDGGRRFFAISQIIEKGNEEAKIPCHVFPKLSDMERRALEFVGNHFRKDFTWREEAMAIATIHAQGRKAKPGSKMVGHTINETAAEIGLSRSLVSRMLDVTRAMISNQKLFAEAENRSQAIEIARQWKDNQAKAEAAEKARNRIQEVDSMPGLEEEAEETPAATGAGGGDAATRSSNVTVDPKWWQMLQSKLIKSYVVGDFFDQTLENNEFTFVEIDPPYGINLKKKVQTKQAATFKEWDAETYPEQIERVVAKVTPAMKSEAWMLFWCAWDWAPTIAQIIEGHGWKIGSTPIVWAKSSQGVTRNPDYNLASNFELCLYARRGAIKIAQQGKPNVFTNRSVPQGNRYHVTQKPIALLNRIFNTLASSMALPSLLVPFAGSGASLLSWQDTQRGSCSQIGFDLSQDHANQYVNAVAEYPVKDKYAKPYFDDGSFKE